MRPFKVTFTLPDRPDYEITEIYQAIDGDAAIALAINLFPNADIVSVQQLHVFSQFRKIP